MVTPPYGCSTGGAKQRADVPRAWPPPTKFRSEIWGVGQVVGPYGSPRLPGQRLAKRKARKEQLVKFGLCPMISECSTAYHVRKSQHSSARAPVGAAVTEQNSLEPRPAARQGASRARNCAAIKRFFF